MLQTIHVQDHSLSLTTSTVVHVCHSLEAGLREIPALMRGEEIKPESEMGSNATPGQHAFPKAVVVGKGFSDEEVEKLRTGEGAQSIPWLVPDDQKMTWGRIAMAAGTAGTALPGIIADRVIQCMKEHELVPGSDKKVEAGVWGF